MRARTLPGPQCALRGLRLPPLWLRLTPGRPPMGVSVPGSRRSPALSQGAQVPSLATADALIDYLCRTSLR
jgi:hypothetical protein